MTSHQATVLGPMCLFFVNLKMKILRQCSLILKGGKKKTGKQMSQIRKIVVSLHRLFSLPLKADIGSSNGHFFFFRCCHRVAPVEGMKRELLARCWFSVAQRGEIVRAGPRIRGEPLSTRACGWVLKAWELVPAVPSLPLRPLEVSGFAQAWIPEGAAMGRAAICLPLLQDCL